MKRTVMAIILLIGVIFPVSCQNQGNPSSTPREMDGRLIGAWKEKDYSKGNIIFKKNYCSYRGPASKYTLLECYCYTQNGIIYFEPADGSDFFELDYHFEEDWLVINGKYYHKID